MRGFVKFLLTLIVVLVIVWVGLWWYAQGQMQNGFTAWVNQLQAQGWKVNYGSETRGSSPAAAKLSLTNLTLASPADNSGRNVVISLPSFALRVDALNPLLLHSDLPSRINVQVGSQIDAAITFGSIAQSQRLDPQMLFGKGKNTLHGGDLNATDISVLASQGSLLVLHIDKLNAHVATDQAAGSTATAISVQEEFDGLAVSPLMTKLLSIPYGGRISRFSFGLNLSGPLPQNLKQVAAQVRAAQGDLLAEQKLLVPLVHQWASQGGNGTINITTVVGPTTVVSGGAVKFDANLQPQGTADVTATHLDQFTADISNAYPSAQDTITQIEAQLSPYLSTSPADGQKLAMHVVYGNGAVLVNGQKTGAMKPVDWNALENPPPAAPVAPGDSTGGDAGPDAVPAPGSSPD